MSGKRLGHWGLTLDTGLATVLRATLGWRYGPTWDEVESALRSPAASRTRRPPSARPGEARQAPTLAELARHAAGDRAGADRACFG